MEVAETDECIDIAVLPSFQNGNLWNIILNEAASRLQTAPAAKNHIISNHEAQKLGIRLLVVCWGGLS